ncbi:MAG: glutamate--tRNA ligase [Candidatus Saccharimonadales bacterium]
MSDIRTRFAPSPTGFIHVGNLRTAVFAWLLAEHNNGQFILRLEDTDKQREIAGSEQHLINSLKAIGLSYAEGPDIGGPYEPYRQSERLEIYKKWADKLISSGRAYADPYSSEQVDAFRQQAKDNKQPFLYRNHRPESPPSWDGSTPLRFKSEPKNYSWHDAILGDLKTGPEVVDDFILIKSDGYPTYNFAHIVDDFEMKISHVIRGQEFISSLPNYLNLYEALGIEPPVLATVPHIFGATGNQKLSKRDGAKDVLDYIRDGYLPEALLNFITSLGWNDGSQQEVYSRAELIEKFSLDRVQKSGARFDEQRLNWMNGTYIRRLSLDDLYQRSASYWPDIAKTYSDDYKKQVLGLIQERLKYLSEIPQLTNFFFTDLAIDPSLISSHKQLSKLPVASIKSLLISSKDSLSESDFTKADLTDRLNQLLVTTKQKPSVLFSLIRIATTSAPASPGLVDSLELLGKDRSLIRIDKQIADLASS